MTATTPRTICPPADAMEAVERLEHALDRLVLRRTLHDDEIADARAMLRTLRTFAELELRRTKV